MKTLASYLTIIVFSLLVVGSAGLTLNRSLAKETNWGIVANLYHQGTKNLTTSEGQVAGVQTIVQAQEKCQTRKPSRKIKVARNSIIDYLYQYQDDYSWTSRQKLAKEMGMENYRGSADQNLELLKRLKQKDQMCSQQVKEMST
jgi:hypothetical protein